MKKQSIFPVVCLLVLFLVVLGSCSLQQPGEDYAVSTDETTGEVNPEFSTGQEGVKKGWVRLYGGNGYEAFYAVGKYYHSGKGHIIAAGYSDSETIGNDSNKGAQDLYIIDVNMKSSTPNWERLLGGNGNDGANRVLFLKDKSFSKCKVLAAGFTESTDIPGNRSAGKKDMYAVLLNSKGKVIWQKQYGGGDDDEISGVVRTGDGGFLLCGTTSSAVLYGKSNGGGKDAFVMKISKKGERKWVKLFGDAGDQTAKNIIKLKDGSFVVVGETRPEGVNTSKFPESAIYLVYLDKKGRFVKTETIGKSRYRYYVSNAARANDGGILISGKYAFFKGSSNDAKAFVLKAGVNGETEWENIYYGARGDSLDVCQAAGGPVFSAAAGSGSLMKVTYSEADGTLPSYLTLTRENVYAISRLGKNAVILGGGKSGDAILMKAFYK